MNFQIFKLVLEKAEEPEIKLPTSIGSSKKQESSRKSIYFCFIDYAKAFDCVDHSKLWKILKEMGIPGIPEHLTCLLCNLYSGQEATVRTRRGTRDWFQIGKGVCQGCILSPCLFNLYADWRRKWQPTPVFFPGVSQGWGSLVGCFLWGRTELDTTEWTLDWKNTSWNQDCKEKYQ